MLYSFLLSTFSFDDVASFGSKPEITLNVLTISSMFLDKIPIVSNEDACETKPYLETLPYVGLSPYMPQNAAGCLTEPPVSDPKAISQRFSDTAAADPPLEPPATLLKSYGFLTEPYNEYSDASLLIYNSNFNVIAKVNFRDTFPVGLSAINFDATQEDLKYVTAEATFKYSIYDIEVTT